MKHLVYGLKHKNKYPPAVREFCLNLHYLSPRGYEFVRETFKNKLPHVNTIRSWYSLSDINSGPGINNKCLEILEQKVIEQKAEGSELIVSLQFDEMSIRKHVQWCHSSKQILGLVTYGNQSNEPTIASQVIVFMITGLNMNLKVPIAYHFITSLNSTQRKELLTSVLNSISNVGVKVSTVTFDGLQANLTMCETLGANLDVYSDEFRPYFTDCNGKRVYIIVDPCHVEKLVRNTLGRKEVLLDNDDEKVKWSFFEDLVSYSQNKGFALTHKMTQKHLQWRKKIMKVDIAVQTLSASTADSMEFLMNEGCEEFQNASSTIKFIRLFNDLFDVFNTKSKSCDNPLKVAMCEMNKEQIISLFDVAEDYLKNLKFVNEKNQTQYLCKSRSKTGFIGYIINMRSLALLYSEYVESLCLMTSITTYSFSQDHLEIMFGICRSLNGFNDNPTVQQFTAAYRKILVQNTVFSSREGNCCPLRIVSKPISNVLEISSRRPVISGNQEEQVPNFVEIEKLHRTLCEVEALEKSGLTENLNNYTTAYIARIIENKIINNMYCQECSNIFSENPKVQNSFESSKLIGKPCIDTVKVCTEADRYLKLRFLTGEINFATIQYAIFQKINFETLYPNTNFLHNEDHKLYFVRSIVDSYVQIKGSYMAKYSTLKSHATFIRSKFHKLIHFRGQ